MYHRPVARSCLYQHLDSLHNPQPHPLAVHVALLIEVPASISQEIALCLYRIVQESLQNVVKHSGAKEAKVELTASQDAIHVRVSDRGVGFKTADVGTKGLGLVSIRERLSALEGQISIQSRPSRGTRIDISIPLAARGTLEDESSKPRRDGSTRTSVERR